jgi:hypothetical protein
MLEPDLFSELPAPPSDGPYARVRTARAPAPQADICRNRHGGSATSEAANERVAPHKGSLRASVLRFIRVRGQFGATVEEISEICKLRYTTVSARVSELKRDGLVIASGRTRKTYSGSEAAVLILTPTTTET